MSIQPTDVLLKRVAKEIGFDLVGVTAAEPVADHSRYMSWLRAGHAADMEYLKRRAQERESPIRLMPNAKSVICCGLSYHYEQPSLLDGVRGKVAKYAWGRDYHKVVKGKLKKLWRKFCEGLDQQPEAHFYVDTGPLLERSLAARSGIGWIGKNTCIIHPKLGSYLFLGEILTDLELTPDEPMQDHCGLCNACIEACPTEAFVEPGVLDSNRCISYQTIENRGNLPEPLREKLGSLIFGCDICQEVCPWNNKAKTHVLEGASEKQSMPLLYELLHMDEADYASRFQGSAMKRAGFVGMKRNAAVAAGNSNDPALIEHLEPLTSEEATEPLRSHAHWASARLKDADG